MIVWWTLSHISIEWLPIKRVRVRVRVRVRGEGVSINKFIVREKRIEL
jgi:hypothetical protein